MSAGSTRWNRDALVGLISLLVIAILVFLGLSMSQANSDYVCNLNNIHDQQQGQCTNGSWGPWTSVNGQQQRTYTGTQTLVTFSGGDIVSCSHPDPSQNAGTRGTITTTNTVCQIVQTGASNGAGTGAGSNGTGTGNGNGNQGGTTQVVTTGAVINSSQTSGSYTDYQDYSQAVNATASITATPSVVKSGDTTVIAWTSTFAKACTVTGTNGDSWPKAVTQIQTTVDADGNQTQAPVQVMPAATTGSQTSSAINQQTTYTLNCTTALGAMPPRTAVVTLVPTFQEQ